VITGAADRVPEHIAQVVYLDAFVPEDGQSLFDLVAPERRQAMEGLVKTEGNEWLLPRFAPEPWEMIMRDMWGVTDSENARWIVDRVGPTPVGHFKRSGAPRPLRRRKAVACLYWLPAVSKRPLRSACRDGASDSALEPSGAGGASSSGRHHAREGGGSAAGPVVLILARGCRLDASRSP
jgi:hypothetical protein